jgi:heat shock protein HtpX
VKHRDTLISTISATIAGAISAIAQFAIFFTGGRDNERGVHPVVAILIMLFAPIAAALIQMAISRAREFEADRGGAEISRDPEALASALEKIHNYAHQLPMQTAEAHPETAQMMIINPLSGAGMGNLFSTHPNTEERIKRLLAMARGLA